MESTLASRVFNFSAGPAALPLPVLEQAQRDLLSLPGAGASVLEISHRSKAFIEILQDAKQQIASLLSLPENYKVFFLQGGSRLQFSMTAMNLLRGATAPAEYLVTGSWSEKAAEEAQREGPVRVAWDGRETNYDRLPSPDELQLNPRAPYVYIASNETIQGVQFREEPECGSAPLVCDASSDFLSRPLPMGPSSMDRYGLIYACAQKNAGPAGVTIVVIREDLLERSQDSLPGYLNYRLHVENDSLYNTPPTFGVYIVGLVARWLNDEMGGLAKINELNQQKAQMLYEVVDQSDGFYQGHAQKANRSLMNVTFRMASEELDKRFLTEAEKHDLHSLKGHRSVGGIRASIYNAMPLAGVETLRDFMRDFASQHAS